MLLRLEYSVGSEVRYLSHLDFLRLFTRALRRAGLPVAYSQGFNPHPKLAFGPPLAVGITSSREYLDLELERTVSLGELVEQFGQALPKGITINQAKEIKERVPALMAVIERAKYTVKVPLVTNTNQADLSVVINRFMARPSIMVTRITKGGPRPKEIRPGLFHLEAYQEEGAAVFNLELQVGSQGAVRPDEVIRALKDLELVPLQEEKMQIHRIGLYLRRGDRLVTPLEIL